MAILFVVEIISFMSHSTETMVVLDQSHDQMVRLRSLAPPSLHLSLLPSLAPSACCREARALSVRKTSSTVLSPSPVLLDGVVVPSRSFLPPSPPFSPRSG